MKTKTVKNREYYVATDLISMESEIFTTMKGCAEYLSISTDTIRRGLGNDTRYVKPNKYLICIVQITKSNNKGNVDHLKKC